MTEQLIVLPNGWLVPGRAVEDAAIDARTDAEAAAVWLQAKGGRSANTFDAYRREALRLLLWLGEQRLSLAELKIEHVHLANPPKHWLRPRKPRRDDILLPTQVLAGALSNPSIDYTRTVLSQLCAYLQDAGYLRRNVFRLSVKPPVVIETVPTRLLDLASWHWLFALLYHTGLRREEAAHGRMGDFVRKERAWSLRVLGKGNKEKFVTVNSVLLRELIHYRQTLGLEDYPVPGEPVPLVASVNAARRSKPLTPRAIGLLVQALGDKAAADCEDPHLRAQLSRMTTHWLRHTNATHRLLAGASLETTQDELGHADPKTTRIYAKATDQRRQEDAEKLAQLAQMLANNREHDSS